MSIEDELRAERDRNALLVAASRANVHDAQDIVTFVDVNTVVRDDSGRVTNADDLVGEVLAARPYLVRTTAAPPIEGVPATPKGLSADAVRTITTAQQAENRRASMERTRRMF